MSERRSTSLRGRPLVPGDSIPAETWTGLLLTVFLILWVVIGWPGATIVRWIALIPALAGLVRYALHRQARTLALPSMRLADDLRQANESLQQQVQELTHVRDIMLALSATFNREAVLNELITAITQLLHFDRGLILLHNESNNSLIFGAYSDTLPDRDNQMVL